MHLHSHETVVAREKRPGDEVGAMSNLHIYDFLLHCTNWNGLFPGVY